ncbi:MAG: transcriptional regulator [Xanthobacteraceae bacterium]|nr:transcriptional regulator [Xanthobacteraceae bacterium]
MKKRIEVIIEAPALKKVVQAFDSRKIIGHTIFPVLAGSGHEGRWDAAGLIGDTGRMVSVMCVLDPAELDAVMIDIQPIIQNQIGIVLISDVQVIRREHF